MQRDYRIKLVGAYTDDRDRFTGNVIEWISLAGQSKVLLISVSKESDARDREDDYETTFLEQARFLFENKGAAVEILCADELQSMWDDARYDLIVLNGTLERQKRRHMSEIKVLSLLKRHLLAGGRLIDIEHNRLGISYLSGFPIKSNRGIMAPDLAPDAAGYTRRQLLHFFKEAGFDRTDCYYPYDHEYHTRAIYTDAWLPDGREGYISRTDRNRLKLFDEKDFCRSVVEEGVFAPFSNALLIEAYGDMAGKQPPKLLFAKYSDDRKRCYAIRTSIYAYASGAKAVTKTPLYAEGRKHVENIHNSYNELSKYYKGYSLQIAPCARMDEGVGFSFIAGKKLTEVIREEAEAKDADRVKWLMKRFIDVVTSPARLSILERKKEQIKYGMNLGFINMFGKLTESEEEILADETYLDITDVDLNFDSVMVNGETWTIYDYEWCVDFPVPFSYVVWKAIHQYFDETGNGDGNDERSDFLLHFGITEGKQGIFSRMEAAFLRYKGVTGDFLREEGEMAYSLRDLIEFLPQKGKSGGVPVRITYADGEVERKLFVPKKITEDGREYETFRIILTDEPKQIRINLSESGGILSDVDIRDERGSSLNKQLAASATRSTGGRTYFFEPEAYLELTPKRRVQEIEIRYVWVSLPHEALEPLKDLIEGGNGNGKRNRRFLS